MLKKAGPASGAQKHWQHVTNDLRSGACKTPLIHRVPVPKPLVIYVGMPLPVLRNPVVQIAALKQPVYCAQFPAIFQG
jgi:hypothetical protein